jgi:hypothetical protein
MSGHQGPVKVRMESLCLPCYWSRLGVAHRGRGRYRGRNRLSGHPSIPIPIPTPKRPWLFSCTRIGDFDESLPAPSFSP